MCIKAASFFGHFLHQEARAEAERSSRLVCSELPVAKVVYRRLPPSFYWSYRVNQNIFGCCCCHFGVLISFHIQELNALFHP